MWDINRAYFKSTYLSRKEWDGENYKDLSHRNEVPVKEINWLRRTLLLAEEIYEKLENSSNVLDEDLKGLRNYIFDCVSLIYSPYQFRTEKLSINIDTL